jgi:hypothetical protein
MNLRVTAGELMCCVWNIDLLSRETGYNHGSGYHMSEPAFESVTSVIHSFLFY